MAFTQFQPDRHVAVELLQQAEDLIAPVLQGEATDRARLTLQGLDRQAVVEAVLQHISGGGVPWTAGNNVRRALMTTVLRAAERGERAPDIMLRAHVHQPATFEFGHTRIFITPSFKLRDEYSHKIGASLAPIGGIIITVDNGAANVVVRTFQPDREQVTKL